MVAKKKRRRAKASEPPVEPGAVADAAVPARHPGGRPTRYRAEYCDQLVKHLGAGYSVESFASVAGVTREVIWRWAKKYADFGEAKARGEAARERYYIQLGQAIATGSLKVLAKEEYVTTPTGEIVRGPDNKPYVNREYRAAKCNAAAWIFLCKNMLGWKDKRDVQLSGSLDAPSLMTREEQVAEIERLHDQRKALETTWKE